MLFSEPIDLTIKKPGLSVPSSHLSEISSSQDHQFLGHTEEPADHLLCPTIDSALFDIVKLEGKKLGPEKPDSTTEGNLEDLESSQLERRRFAIHNNMF